MGCKSSVQKKIETNNKVEKYFDCINASLGLAVSQEDSLVELREILNNYREQKDFELEDIRSLCLKYKNEMEVSKREHVKEITKLKGKISIQIEEVSSLKEIVKSSKENERIQKTLRSRLLKYQMINNNIIEENQRLRKELFKAKNEIAQLNKNFKSERKNIKGDNAKLIEELSLENKALKKKNKELMKECKERMVYDLNKCRI